MFVATSPTTNTAHPSSYIVAATTATTTAATTATTSSSVITTANSPPDSTATAAAATNATPQTLSDIQLICIQRKKRSKRHIYLTFVESRPLSSTNEQPCIEVVRKANSSSSSSASATPPVIYGLNECISFEYFDTVKNDFQAFIHAYFESYTISIFFSEENFEKKSLIIKHLEYMYHSKAEKSTEMNNNSSSDANQSQSTIAPSPAQQQTPILPCPSTTEHILHTFDVSLIPYEPIIHRDHILVGPARLYFTTTDLYIASIHCNRMDLKVTITNQCPSKDKAILCIPYFTIKNYGNRSNIFLIELGKSNYGNGEIHMKCHSSSLASTIHLLVSPVIEERPLILSSAFQNQLLTHKRMEKSKNIHPPIQLTSDTTTQSILDSPLTVIKKKAMETSTPTESRPVPSASNDLKSRFVVGFFRTLSKNVSHLRRSATFHNNNNNNNNSNMTSNGHNVQQSTISENPVKSKYIGFNTDDSRFHDDQQHINLPDPQRKADSISNTSSTLTKQTSETVLTSTLTINTNRTEPTLGTYIDMGPTIPKSNQNPPEEMEQESIMEEPAATAEIGVNTTISLSPNVRSAIIVGNSVHLIADEKTLFPIGQRSFTSPASVMQPFKTQLNGPSPINPYASADLITSSPNSSGSLHQPNSGSNSQKSLLLSYGIVTFNTNELLSTEQLDPTNASVYDGSTLDQRLNSDISLMSTQQQGSAVHSFDNVLSSSSAHIFRTLSVSASNIVDTPTGQIIFIDDHVNDQTATYLLGAPPIVNEETVSNNSTRPSPLNPATSISRAQLSHIDEEKAATHDPYALVEPTPRDHPPPTALSILPSSSLPSSSEKSIHYAEVLLPTHSNSNHDQFECNDPQQQTTIAASATIQSSHSEDGNDENNDIEELERERKDLAASTKLYTDIDFHQTQRRERIVQLGAKAKLEDQAPPFVL